MACRGVFFEYLCGMKNKCIILLVLITATAFSGCGKYPVNPYYPNAIINFTIDINRFPDLQVVSGYAYVFSDLTSSSRGIIIFRKSWDEFVAYDRLPPNYPDACADSAGNTIRLVVESPFVVDHCNNAYYNILNGDIIINEDFGMMPSFPIDSVPIYPLIQYHTNYDGAHEIRVYN